MDEQTRAAYQTLADVAYRTPFFQKLAAVYGVRPNGPADEHHLLDAAAMLRERHDLEQQKSAADGGGTPFLAAAVGGLRQALGMPPADPTAGIDLRAKQAAAENRKNPAVAQAALTFAHWLATQAG